MSGNNVLTFIWKEIIRLGFSPKKDNEIKKWMNLYFGSLDGFWGLNEYPFNRKKETIDFNELNLSIQLKGFNKNLMRSPVSIDFYDIDKELIIWSHDVDNKYFFISDYINEIKDKDFMGKSDANLDKFRKSITKEKIKAVLDGLIFHPRVHQHMHFLFDNHEIRIGGGIENPFLFLFHLRYQLCPSLEQKEAEEERLIELFKNYFEKNKKITKSELLAVPE